MEMVTGKYERLDIRLKLNITFFYKIQKGRGYVFYNKDDNKVGMTYLLSVWDTLPDKQEFQNVYANSPGFELYEYYSLTWEYLAHV